jgi:hypothetical protein
VSVLEKQGNQLIKLKKTIFIEQDCIDFFMKFKQGLTNYLNQYEKDTFLYAQKECNSKNLIDRNIQREFQKFLKNVSNGSLKLKHIKQRTS